MKRTLYAVTALLALLMLSASGCAGVKSSRTSSAEATEAVAGGKPPAAAEVRLVVSRDFGGRVLTDVTVPAGQGMSVMRLLAEHAKVDTGYGGQFVSGIDGLRSSFGSVAGAQAADWFYWVDGVMADVGAEAWRLHGGETVWWDYHRWAGAMFIPMSLDAFPAPFTGKALAVVSDFSGGDVVQRWASGVGLTLGQAQTLAQPPAAAGLVLATGAQAEATSWLRDILARGPAQGVFAKTQAGQVLALSPDGSKATPVAAVAFATRGPQTPEEPLLIVLGDTPQDISDLLAALQPSATAHRVAVALPVGAPGLVALPGAGTP